jgi:hypothetical protein
MITLQQVYDVLTNRQYAELRAFCESAADTAFEKCDADKKAILLSAMRDAAVYRGVAGDHDRKLLAIVECIERGLHPYHDSVTMEILTSIAARSGKPRA